MYNPRRNVRRIESERFRLHQGKVHTGTLQVNTENSAPFPVKKKPVLLMVEERKSKINSGVIIAALLLILIVAQIALLCAKVFFGATMTWFVTLLPTVITGGCILLAALYFVIGSMLVMRETRKIEENEE